MLIIIKLLALVIAITYGISIIGRIRYGQGISSQMMLLEAISLVTFLTIQFQLYK